MASLYPLFLWLIIQVIVLGMVGIYTTIITIILVSTNTTLLAFTATKVDDDDFANSLEEVSVIGWWNIVLFSTLILGFILQLFAALRYSVCMLCCVVVILLFNFAWDISFAIVTPTPALDVAIIIIIDVIKYGVFVYPVVGLISEIKRGVMSKETYPREAYSCCCQPKPR